VILTSVGVTLAGDKAELGQNGNHYTPEEEEILDDLASPGLLEHQAADTVVTSFSPDTKDSPGGPKVTPQPDKRTWGDRTLKKLRHTHEVICWMAAAGANNAAIAGELGYSQARMSVIMSNTQVQARIKEIQNQHWGENIQNRFNAVLPRAMDVAEQIIDGEIPAKTSERWDAAKWLLEKVTGKPKQEIEVDGGNSIRSLIQALDQVKAARAQGTEAQLTSEQLIDVKPVPPKDEIDDWVSQNVPQMKQEKE